MNKEQFEEMMLKVFEAGAIVGFTLSESHYDLPRSEIAARARNRFESMKEELFSGN